MKCICCGRPIQENAIEQMKCECGVKYGPVLIDKFVIETEVKNG